MIAFEGMRADDSDAAEPNAEVRAFRFSREFDAR